MAIIPYDLEFGLMELLAPDIVIYLDIPLEAALARIGWRLTETGTDINECDTEYLRSCWQCGQPRSSMRRSGKYSNWSNQHA